MIPAIERAFRAGYCCVWTGSEYLFDPSLRPGDPEGAFRAYLRQVDLDDSDQELPPWAQRLRDDITGLRKDVMTVLQSIEDQLANLQADTANETAVDQKVLTFIQGMADTVKSLQQQLAAALNVGDASEIVAVSNAMSTLHVTMQQNAAALAAAIATPPAPVVAPPSTVQPPANTNQQPPADTTAPATGAGTD